eukprot:1371713-Amorphochlora_amoeboformis.AAC.2
MHKMMVKEYTWNNSCASKSRESNGQVAADERARTARNAVCRTAVQEVLIPREITHTSSVIILSEL